MASSDSSALLLVVVVAIPSPSSAKHGSQTRRKYKRMHSLNSLYLLFQLLIIDKYSVTFCTSRGGRAERYVTVTSHDMLKPNLFLVTASISPIRKLHALSPPPASRYTLGPTYVCLTYNNVLVNDKK